MIVVDSFLLTTSSMEVEECAGSSTNYKFLVAPFSITNTICRDTAINIPIKVEQSGSTSTTALPSIDTVKPISFFVDKKTYKRLIRKYGIKEQGK